jgi:hypothetical protein
VNGLVVLLERTENGAPSHSFTTNFEPRSDAIFGGLFCYHKMIKWCTFSL